MKHHFVGFGFGPIQAGLFLAEAFASGRFERLVVAEVDAEIVQAVRNNRGRYAVNIAHNNRVETQIIDGMEIFNPLVAEDRSALVKAIEESTDIFTSLPNVNIYTAGGPNSVAALLAQGLPSYHAPATLIYTAENNNHAAEILQEKVQSHHAIPGRPVQYLNTVIGKMSQVISDPAEIKRLNLTPMTPDGSRAFLVESFNRILVTKISMPDFRPGITVFGEKDNLLPFEEAKLYGHNAIHALLAYLGTRQACTVMTELKAFPQIMAIARQAFLNESGAALIKKYRDLNDPLFTPSGFQAYADDLLERITNPYLNDAVARAARDPQRKLGWDDRLIGAMRLALSQEIEPTHLALGAVAACQHLIHPSVDGSALTSEDHITNVLQSLWPNTELRLQDVILQYIRDARSSLMQLGGHKGSL